MLNNLGSKIKPNFIIKKTLPDKLMGFFFVSDKLVIV